jgi:hypothetical protein
MVAGGAECGMEIRAAGGAGEARTTGREAPVCVVYFYFFTCLWSVLLHKLREVFLLFIFFTQTENFCPENSGKIVFFPVFVAYIMSGTVNTFLLFNSFAQLSLYVI